jgi:hypothetical protein
MNPIPWKKLVLRGSIVLALALSMPGVAAQVERPRGGDAAVLGFGDLSPGSVPPFIDAMDGIMIKGASWNADPALWPHTATVTVKGANYGVQEARVKLRIEGKGDPVGSSVPQQTALVTDDSGSMSSNDPNNIRVAGMDTYIDQLSPPDEVSVTMYSSTYRCVNNVCNPPAELRVSLTTNYQGAKQNKGQWNSTGGTDTWSGLKLGLDDLIPKKKTGFSWNVIHLTDGCWNGANNPQQQVDRMAQESIKMWNIGLFPNPTGCEQDLIAWSQQTGGKYYWAQSAADLQQVYKDIAQGLKSDIAGRPPKTGAPMIQFKLTNDIEVIPGSFVCDSATCTAANPTNLPTIVPNNKGLKLEWAKPVNELRIKQYWQLEFGVRCYTVGKQIKVNDLAQSFVEYDRYDGTPGGSDVFEQLYVDVTPDVPGVGGAGVAEPPSPPPPPPHGGIPQLIPQPQQIPITYIQNLPVLHGVTQVQGIPLQYLLGSAMGMAVADRVKMKSRIKQGVKIAMASM